MFVQRENGKIVGLFELQQPGYAEEEIAADHPDVVAFLNPVPQTLSRAQTINALVAMGMITADEGEKSNIEVPQAVAAVFKNMSAAQETAARILWLNFVEAQRHDPLIAALAAANDMSEADIDNFFRSAAA